ncbi:competence protein ComFA [Thalassobacillus cyri]|uniref:Competence protein ComFA n=1 Tax=Thalassobacillus cyri TaxID=571932 RepID=A0A1H4AUD1_9BACI|nr:DEAD/DEAH box helicase [Thalassobacillus cyri]SEA39242.1 competence protein ComFA [Thalassobacillus cyri]
MNNLIPAFRTYYSNDFSWIPSPLEQPPDLPSFVNPSLVTYLSGKLLLKTEISLNTPQLNELISLGLLDEIPAIEKHAWGNRCRRCGNQKSYLFAKLPDNVVYCRKCIVMGRVSEQEHLYAWRRPVSWDRHPPACKWTGELTTFQQQAADRIIKAIQEKNQRLLVWAVCGAGKTEMLFPGLSLAFSQGKRVCLATPRADVVKELLPRFVAAFPDVSIQALYGESPDKQGNAQFLIATTHQLLRYGRAFDVLIIDEIDAFPYHADASLPYATERAAKDQASFIYLTATPRPKHEREINRKKLPAVFVPRRFHGHPLPVPRFVAAFDIKSLEKEMLSRKVWDWLERRKRPDRQLLVFVPTIPNAEKVEKILAQRYKKVTCVHASDSDRQEKVYQFRKSVYDVLVTTTILERGVTFPSVDVIVLDSGHAVFDQAALIQIAGRAGRSSRDPDGEVIFFHQGKTDAMVKAVETILKMNRLGRRK